MHFTFYSRQRQLRSQNSEIYTHIASWLGWIWFKLLILNQLLRCHTLHLHLWLLFSSSDFDIFQLSFLSSHSHCKYFVKCSVTVTVTVMRRIIILDRIRIRIIFVFQNQTNTNTNNIRFQNHNKYEYKYKYYSNSTQICLKMLWDKQVKVQKNCKIW